jgi:hypothetical protein
MTSLEELQNSGGMDAMEGIEVSSAQVGKVIDGNLLAKYGPLSILPYPSSKH